MRAYFALLTKPIIYALLATIGYAFCTTMMEQKFSKYNNLLLVVCFGTTVCVVSGTALLLTKTDAPEFQLPTGPLLGLMLVVGLVYAASDYLYLGAYTNKGDLFSITCIAILMPVFASAFKFVMTRSLPNLIQVLGYAIVLAGLLLVTKGSMTK